MQYRTLGPTNIEVSAIGFGCARIGGVFSESSTSKENTCLLEKALDSGINYYDTADMYTQGESERLLGLAFSRQRDKVIIASKGGYVLPAQKRFISKVKPILKPIVSFLGIKRSALPAGAGGSLSQDFSAQYLSQAVENSLRRLKTDYLDIYQVHSPPPAVIKDGAFIQTLKKMQEQGKVRFFGVAADNVDDALLCLQHLQIPLIQFPFGMLDMEALESFLPAAEKKGVGLIARGAFAAGLLKETLTRQDLIDITPKTDRILFYQKLAKKYNRPLLEIALQFSLKFQGVSVSLLGMRTNEHLIDNLRYFDAPPLTEEQVQEIVLSQEQLKS
jgi:aryl-alcohol dehydrogenase-like predicted oxidoreductase